VSSVLSLVADAVIIAADILRDRRKAEKRSTVALTEHERRCVMRYRGRAVAKRLGVA
jgi:hypothetical protein